MNMYEQLLSATDRCKEIMSLTNSPQNATFVIELDEESLPTVEYNIKELVCGEKQFLEEHRIG